MRFSLVTSQGYSRAEADRSLSINPVPLNRWIKENDSEDGHAFRGNVKLTAEQLEIRHLREENKRLKMEKEILKRRRPSLLKKRNEIFVYSPT